MSASDHVEEERKDGPASTLTDATKPAFNFVPPPATFNPHEKEQQHQAQPQADKLQADPNGNPNGDDDAMETEEMSEFERHVSSLDCVAKYELGRSLYKAEQSAQAVDVLARAVEQTIAEYGEFSLRSALVHRAYGEALLQHYQKNSSVLGEVIGNDEEKKKKVMGDEEEAEEAEEQPTADGDDLVLSYEVLETARVIYARHYNGPGKVVEKAAKDEPMEGVEEKKNGEESAAAAASSSSAAASEPPAAASSSAAQQETEGESKQNDGDSTAKKPDMVLSEREIGLELAHTYESLASFFMEKEDFPSATTEYSKALNLSTHHLPAHSRDLAALHMDMAVCSLFDNKPDAALVSYKSAREVFEKAYERLKERIEKEKENPTPLPPAESSTPSSSSSATASSSSASSSSSAASSNGGNAETTAPKTMLEKYENEKKEFDDILDELKERIDDITKQLSLPADQQALNIIKQQKEAASSPSKPVNPFAAAAASLNPFARASSSGSNSAAAAASSSPTSPFSTALSSFAAAAAAAVSSVTNVLTVKRKKPAPSQTSAAAASTTTTDATTKPTVANGNNAVQAAAATSAEPTQQAPSASTTSNDQGPPAKRAKQAQ